ncbi:MAG: RNA 2',3'-cyclic phosphodiesterase [Clostridia bacterium]|jgi:2'-5' RNA ligase|nr:RNA 2',3'-cyclic phosphodiesterase [Clostridia bacterium]MBR0435727.1 RNA 2',3'-cyclic phosphodiesterase [Clostridia bacterium]
MRLFIAVPLPKDVQRAVYTAEEGLRSMSSAGRFVPFGNHHITLRFLGESSALADIAAAMHEAVKDARPFVLRLGAPGSFTHGGARTSFLSVTGDLDELNRIHETLEAALFEYGFAGGKVRFTPHITLARAVELSGDISRVRVPNAGFTVRSIVLFESTNENGRMVYTPVHTETF